jgi:hypothetical protein
VTINRLAQEERFPRQSMSYIALNFGAARLDGESGNTNTGFKEGSFQILRMGSFVSPDG